MLITNREYIVKIQGRKTNRFKLRNSLLIQKKMIH